MNAVRDKLAFEVIETYYPVSEMSDRDFQMAESSLRNLLNGCDPRYPEDMRYSAEVRTAAEKLEADIAQEQCVRSEMISSAPQFAEGDHVVTNALQRGWPSAGCADPPIGTKGVVEGPAPVEGKVMVRVHLRELGYECSEEDDEDDYKSFYFWASTLERVNG